MTLKAALPVSILSLSQILGACGSSPSGLGSTPQTGGTDPAPTQAQQVQPVEGDVTPLFGDHSMPAPYKDRIPA